MRADTATTDDEEVPIADLITLFGTVAGQQVTILKDDGCNTNVISRTFVNRNRHLFNIEKTSVTIHHSNKKIVEKAEEVIVGAEIGIGSHTYRSNWIVADCRYDILLGMPWNVDCRPSVDYKSKTIKIGNNTLPTYAERNRSVKVCNMGVKKFRSLLRKKKNSDDFMVLRLRQINNVGIEKLKEQTIQEDPDVKALKEEFNTVFRNDLPHGLPPKRDVDHKIEVQPDSSPPHRGIFQLSPAELLATKEYVTDLLKKGKIRPSKSPYGAPLFFVKQKGQLRGVIDYRALNRITKHNNAPIPRTDEMFDGLGQAQLFSKLDLKTGFHQIRIAPEDIKKTAFKTKYGHFEFLVMPMGLRNSPATFQTLINSIFRDCIDEFVVVYLDDILIFSDSKEEHMKHLRIVSTRLRDNELYVGNKKFDLLQKETEFLGLKVGTNRIKIGDDRKKRIQDWPTPKTITELRSFLGIVQFFRRFIRDFSRIAAPLTNLTRKNSCIANWDSACDSAFGTLKDTLISAPIMRAPDWTRQFRCHMDASQVAVGGSLTQLSEDGNEHVISFF